jgi:hypothetical protein
MAGKKAKAHHEAGHAVIARVLGVEVSYAAMLNTNVETHSALYLTKNSSAAAQIVGAEKDIKILLAGALAQCHYRPMTRGRMQKAANSGGWEDDISTASRLVAQILYFQTGRTLSELMSDPNPEAALKALGQSDAAETLWERLWQETKALVNEHWPAIERVAAAMLERRALNQSDIDALIRG